MKLNLVGLVRMLTRYQNLVDRLDKFIRAEGDGCEWLADEYVRVGEAIKTFEGEASRIGGIVEMTKISH